MSVLRFEIGVCRNAVMEDEIELEENQQQIGERLQNGHCRLDHDGYVGECEGQTNHQG